MTSVGRLVSINARASARTIAAPQRADVMTGAFRTAFRVIDDLPCEFRSLLAKLDADRR